MKVPKQMPTQERLLNRRGIFLLITIILTVLLITVLCGIIFTCKEKDVQVKPVEEPAVIEEEIEEQIETPVEESESNAEPRVSYQVSRPLSSLSALGRLRGMGVLVSEIDPVNFENPDLDVLRQMGADPYLISYLSGEQFYRNGNLDKAISEYTASINRNNEFLHSYISRGNVWMKKREYSRAIDDYSRAIRLDGNKAEVYNYRGYARAEMAARNNYSGMSLAIEDYSRAISINKNYVDALINRSHALYQTGDFARVIEDCDRIIALEPSNAVIWNRRGSAWYAKENDDKAITDFTEAIRLRSDYAIAWYNRANAWYNKRELDKSLADLNRCLAINPSFADAYTSRGKIFQLMGNNENAAADFASAQRLQR
jgi:tetratricopeptide (TPR) repeat protein